MYIELSEVFLNKGEWFLLIGKIFMIYGVLDLMSKLSFKGLLMYIFVFIIYNI